MRHDLIERSWPGFERGERSCWKTLGSYPKNTRMMAMMMMMIDDAKYTCMLKSMIIS